MQMVADGYRGLGLLLRLNWDTLLYGAMIAGSLALGGVIGAALVPDPAHFH